MTFYPAGFVPTGIIIPAFYQGFDMNRCKFIFCGLSAFALAGPVVAGPLLVEQNFDDITTLTGSGWTRSNQSLPLGSTNWYQGDALVFAAHSGTSDSYIAANYNNAAPGGVIENWLISPVFSTEFDTNVTFWARADVFGTFSDQLAYGYVAAAGSPVAADLFGTSVLGGAWTQYSAGLSGQGAGSSARFAFRYFGAADTSNYIGIDTFQARIPEPGSLALVALAGFVLLGSRVSSKRV